MQIAEQSLEFEAFGSGTEKGESRRASEERYDMLLIEMTYCKMGSENSSNWVSGGEGFKGHSRQGGSGDGECWGYEAWRRSSSQGGQARAKEGQGWPCKQAIDIRLPVWETASYFPPTERTDSSFPPSE